MTNTPMPKRLALSLAVAVLLLPPSPAQAQFGFGGIVHDPGVMGQVVMVVRQTLQQIRIATDTFRVVQDQRDLIRDMSTALPKMGRYATPNWREGDAGAAAWQELRQPLPRAQHAAMQPRLLRELERIARVDQMTQRAVNQLGYTRDYARAVSDLLAILNADVTRSTPRTLTQVADTIAAGELVQARQQESADRLRAAQMELELEARSRERDADAEHADMAARTQAYFLRAGERD